jgi:subtilisin family serine protease
VNSHLTDDHLQNLNQQNNLSINVNDTSGYFTKHNISRIYTDNPYLYTPSFNTGLIDSGYYENHEDFNNFKSMNTSINDDHGTGVFSLSFGSNLNEELGTLGIVNAFTFLSKSSRLETDQEYIEIADARIIGSSYTLYLSTSYRTLKHDLSVAEERVHVNKFSALRTEIIDHPNNLYVFSAGNEKVDPKWMNGAIHYTVNSSNEVVLDRLDNVIVVGAMGYDEILHYYSDFGESVDVATISGVYAAKEVVDGISTYYERTDNTDYGVRQFASQNDSGDFDGTSASQPITAGMAALLLSVDPSMTGAELKNALLSDYTTETVERRWTGS